MCRIELRRLLLNLAVPFQSAIYNGNCITFVAPTPAISTDNHLYSPQKSGQQTSPGLTIKYNM